MLALYASLRTKIVAHATTSLLSFHVVFAVVTNAGRSAQCKALVMFSADVLLSRNLSPL